MRRRPAELCILFVLHALPACSSNNANAQQENGSLDRSNGDAAAADTATTDATNDEDARGPDCVLVAVDPALDKKVKEIWKTAQPHLLERTSLETVIRSPYTLYNVQLFTANLLLYAELHQDAGLIEALAALYRRAFGALRLRTTVLFHYAKAANGSFPRLQVLALRRPARMWTYPAPDGHSVTHIPGHAMSGAVLDRGAFDDHGDYAYAGYTESEPGCETCTSSARCIDTCDVFPGWKDAQTPEPHIAPHPVTGIGWDLSHARRLPPVYDSLWRHREIVGTSFPTKEAIHQLARQLAFVVYRADANPPQFANFFDGTAGWCRVNYGQRVAFGHDPGYMTRIVTSCGYGFWTPLEPALRDALDNISDMASTTWHRELLARPETTTASLFDAHWFHTAVPARCVI